MIVFVKNSTADDHGQPRQVPLDDVRPALRGRREAHAAEAGVAAGVHQDQRHERGREQHVETEKNCEHRQRAKG